MKKLIITTVICLITGAITPVAIAHDNMNFNPNLPGSYSKTCSNCALDLTKNSLTCQCKNKLQKEKLTSLANPKNCHTITNENGLLNCTVLQPVTHPGTNF